MSFISKFLVNKNESSLSEDQKILIEKIIKEKLLEEMFLEILSVERTLDSDILSMLVVSENEKISNKKFDWSDEFNIELIKLGIRSIDADTESQRFSSLIAHYFQNCSLRFGAGYANSVFKEYLMENNFSKQEQIKNIWDGVHGNSPSKDTQAYNECKKLIENMFKEVASFLIISLNYKEQEAEKILISSLASFLDQRFHIELRRKLFPNMR